MKIILNILLIIFLITGVGLATAGQSAAEQAVKNNHDIYYQIAVGSFYDSDGDGVGDLQGILQKLDYLNDGDRTTDTDLGINGILLMPILAAGSQAGYDVIDFYQINPLYGDEEDLKALLTEAHRRGIKVLFDLPLNQTSYQHPWFKEGLHDQTSQFRDFYVWLEETGELMKERGMPVLNYDNPELRKWMLDISKYWLYQGFDGFRIDRAGFIFTRSSQQEQLKWWKQYYQELKEINPSLFLIADTRGSSNMEEICLEGCFTSAYNYRMAMQIIKSVKIGYNTAFNQSLDYIYSRYGGYKAGNFIDGILLTDHEFPRLLDQLEGDNQKVKMAVRILLTLPGTPFIYFGEEMGMSDADGQDKLFPWFDRVETDQETKAELSLNYQEITSAAGVEQGDESILSHYRSLIRFRLAHPLLFSGQIQLLKFGQRVIAYRRFDGEQEYYIFHNLAKEKQEVGVKKGVLEVIFNTGGKLSVPYLEDGQYYFMIDPAQSLIIERK